jgi:CDP-paratose 2-epimerase
MRIFITGGCGFVGSNLATSFKTQFPQYHVTVFDNLKRRGSELNLAKFRKLGIEFIHGDIREESDLMSIGESFDLMIEASAEPSVHSGNDGNVSYLLKTNLVGTLNCLEFARKYCPNLIFLSTSRIYSIDDLKAIPLEEKASRLTINESSQLPIGLSPKGISENFNSQSYRSLYGATKLSSELIIQEYIEVFGLNAIINRCAVIAGPGQWGKVDQGVFTLWVANHYFNKSLKYTGFGGQGKQVRDLLHPQDLFTLILKQMNSFERFNGQIYNIGGGQEVSTSLLELTSLCQEVTSNKIEISSQLETAKVDIPYFVSDCQKAKRDFDFVPEKNVLNIVEDIYNWLKVNENLVKEIFS